MLQSVVECVAAHAAEAPGRLSVADSSTSLSYGELWECVRGYAGHLAATGVAPGACVAIECDQSADYVIAMLACHLAGAIAVPLERNAAEARRREIAADTDAALYIGKPANSVEGARFEPLGDARSHRAGAPAAAPRFPDGSGIAEILYSTGTTGKSKGIVISHRNNMAIAENIVRGVEMKPGNVEIVPMPLSHSHGLRTTYANLVNGSAVVLADGVLSLKKVFDLMDSYGVSSMDISPSMLSIIFKLSKDRLGDYAGALDYVQLGSAPLAEADKLRLTELLPRTRLYNFYGSTEAGRSCLFDFATMSGKPGCIGRPAANARFIVVDAERNPIESSASNPGLLASAGDINMVGYFKEPELTAETTDGEYIYTKDLGYIGEDGLIYLIGRADDVINFGGVKVAPEEIESAILGHPDVADCACIPVHDAISGQVPVLCICLEDGAVYDAGAFKRFCSKALDASKQPQRIEVVDEIPRTFNGKIKRKELVERCGGRRA